MRSMRIVSFRALSVLALALTAVVLITGIAPGAANFLTKSKAKKLFYTKAKADNRFLTAGELGTTVEGWHEVGAAGEPGFGTGPCAPPGPCWGNFGSVFNTAGFYKDPFGVVHLKGVALCIAATCYGSDPSGIIFTLPAGYHPAAREALPVLSSVAPDVARVDVTATGEVVLDAPDLSTNDWVSLDGITFRAA